jgi:hypothetical protein
MTSWGEDEWTRKGATLSDKSVCKEFGLTREEIHRAARAGKLQYREASDYVRDRKARAELDRIEGELRRLKLRMRALEARKAQLEAGGSPGSPEPGRAKAP